MGYRDATTSKLVDIPIIMSVDLSKLMQLMFTLKKKFFISISEISLMRIIICLRSHAPSLNKLILAKKQTITQIIY